MQKTWMGTEAVLYLDFSYVEAIRTLEKNLAMPRHRHRNWRQKGCLQLF